MSVFRPRCGVIGPQLWRCNLHRGHPGPHACTHRGWAGRVTVDQWEDRDD